MLLKEFDQILAGNAAVLRTGDAVTFESAGVEPFADGSRGHLADLRDLACGEHLHIFGLRYLPIMKSSQSRRPSGIDPRQWLALVGFTPCEAQTTGSGQLRC